MGLGTIIFYLISGIGFIVVGFYMFEDTNFWGGIMIVCGGFCLFGATCSLGEYSTEYFSKKELNHAVKKGKWEFPCEEFYNKCKNMGITSFKDEFSIKKAQQIMAKILDENKVYEKYYSIYLEPKKMQELYKNGPKYKEQRIKIEQEKKNKEVIKQKEIKEVKPNEENEKRVKQYAELSVLKGAKKRARMLSFITEEKKKKYDTICKKNQTVDNYSDYLLNRAEHNNSNWAIAGGIAEGLAGPAAGVAAAVDAMSREQQIQEDNRTLEQCAVNLKYISRTKFSEMISEAKAEYEKALAEEESAKNKVVLSKPEGKEIAKNIETAKTKVTKHNDGVLEVKAEVSIKSPLKLDVPGKTKMVIDGTLSGKIYYNGKFVDDVKLILPIYGIMNGSKQTVTATGYCTKSAEYEGEYTAKITDAANLWVMEY